MLFILLKASDPDFKGEVKFNSIEDLAGFIRQADTEVIIGQSEDDALTITLYDDLIE